MIEKYKINSNHVLFVLDSCYSGAAIVDRNFDTKQNVTKPREMKFPALHVLGSCSGKEEAVEIWNNAKRKE